MKKIAFGLLAVLLAGFLNSCTNDETDSEFETLNPSEQQQQTA